MNLKYIFPAFLLIVISVTTYGQQAGLSNVYIKATSGVLTYSDNNENLPPNYQQLKTEFVNLSMNKKYQGLQYDRNDIATIIYGLAFMYFLTDGIYNLYAGMKDYEKRHLLNPYEDSTKNFLFAGGLALFMVGISSILCTDQFGCIPGRRNNSY